MITVTQRENPKAIRSLVNFDELLIFNLQNALVSFMWNVVLIELEIMITLLSRMCITELPFPSL